ncbi:hypothetical protein ABZ345_06925 [Lentzea sp. NPDC005914]|uniref:hypothetical protein n=1 Tax=Lentzea sp. NPDC005914 TaxID=3154572 RepID=UPI0034110E48
MFGKKKRAIELPRWAGPFYLAAGVITLVWAGVLFTDFLNVPTRCPDTKIRCGAFLTTSLRQYTLSWVVFDIALATMLVVTGWLAMRRRDHVQLPAAVTGALLFVDAWFDTMSSARRDRPLAWAQALFVELPLGVLCLWIAGRAERRRRVRLETALQELDDLRSPEGSRRSDQDRTGASPPPAG